MAWWHRVGWYVLLGGAVLAWAGGCGPAGQRVNPADQFVGREGAVTIVDVEPGVRCYVFKQGYAGGIWCREVR